MIKIEKSVSYKINYLELENISQEEIEEAAKKIASVMLNHINNRLYMVMLPKPKLVKLLENYSLDPFLTKPIRFNVVTRFGPYVK